MPETLDISTALQNQVLGFRFSPNQSELDAFARFRICERQLRHPDGLTLFQNTASAIAGSADLTELPEVSDLQELPSDVERFCIRHGLLHCVLKALDLAKQIFPTHDAPIVRVESDPDSNDEWITIDVTVSNGIEDALAREAQFNEQRIAHIPWPQRDKIRIVCDIV